ncbi:uncharacterized protein LOC135123217 [Zophobas morio]|uniref:uncharacterized protein LOC135123217 n=1 Tax=Zophobas morio TaxID=2755281 RepID=UPI003083AE33
MSFVKVGLILTDPVVIPEVYYIISSVANKKSKELDGIPYYLLKYVPETTIGVLTNLISTSFSTGIFPDELKTAIIVPIHKKGGRTQDAIVSKLMEIFDSLDDKKKVVGIYFDLSRAFDTLNHNLICDKLEAYVIGGVALQWIKKPLAPAYLREAYWARSFL